MKIEVDVPNQLIKELHDLVKAEGYMELYDVFPKTIPEDLEILILDLKQAKLLLRAAQVEHSRAFLKYPYSIDDQEPFDPEQEECFDDVQHFYEKTDFYMGIAIKELEQIQPEVK